MAEGLLRESAGDGGGQCPGWEVRGARRGVLGLECHTNGPGARRQRAGRPLRVRCVLEVAFGNNTCAKQSRTGYESGGGAPPEFACARGMAQWHSQFAWLASATSSCPRARTPEFVLFLVLWFRQHLPARTRVGKKPRRVAKSCRPWTQRARLRRVVIVRARTRARGLCLTSARAGKLSLGAALRLCTAELLPAHDHATGGARAHPQRYHCGLPPRLHVHDAAAARRCWDRRPAALQAHTSSPALTRDTNQATRPGDRPAKTQTNQTPDHTPAPTRRRAKKRP